MAGVAGAIVELKRIGKTYDTGVEALREVDLEFPPGQLSTLLGPSGCGKTTLLKIIGGLIPASAGEVWVKGKRVKGPGPERAFVFQDFALLPWATVLRNVAFGLELRGVPKGHSITVNEVRLSAGAGLIVMLCGSIVTMPGLPRVPAAELMHVDDEGRTVGLA